MVKLGELEGCRSIGAVRAVRADRGRQVGRNLPATAAQILNLKVKFLPLCDQIKFFLVATCRTCAGLKGLKWSHPQLGLLAFILLLTARVAPRAQLVEGAWAVSYRAPPAHAFSLLRGRFQEHELRAIWVCAHSSSSILQPRERRPRAMWVCARLLPPASAAQEASEPGHLGPPAFPVAG